MHLLQLVRPQVRAFMPALGYENCGNATLVAARAVPNPLGKAAYLPSASVPTLDLSTATFLELHFAEFGRCAPVLPLPGRMPRHGRASNSTRQAA